MSSFKGKVVAITGAASGIGRATALECSARGASLALSDVNPAALQDLVNELKAQSIDVIASHVDVSNYDSVDRWTAEVIEHFGRLDCAANVAGVGSVPGGKVLMSIVDTPNEHWDQIMSVNITGMFYCVRAQLRVMKSGASILNVASTSGFGGREMLAAYCASKHAVIGFTQSAAREVAEKGIRVNAIAPGPTATPMLQHLLTDGGSRDRPLTGRYDGVPMKRLGTAEEMAKTICFALSDDASWTTGHVFLVDGGMKC